MRYFLLKWFIVMPVLRVVFRVEVTGRKNLPRGGGTILAANHLHFVDSPIIAAMVRRQVSFGAMVEFFEGKSLKGRLIRWFFVATQQIPVDRLNAKRAQEQFIDEAVMRLNDGRVIGIHPEGVSSPDGRLYKARGGVARLAISTKAPIVPIGIMGTRGGARRGWRRKKVRLVFGAPITYAEYDGLSQFQLARLVADRIAELTGQARADSFAPVGEK